jgi:transcriptional regulator with GAF, ATPase, and Fis domain
MDGETFLSPLPGRADPGIQRLGIVGNSSAILQVLDQLRLVARTDSTVLIMGETGTGKEVAAHAVHVLSGRANQPFVKLNCAALPSNLLESELFGHERGAFTGASTQRVGRFELAKRGSLFLDEVGEMAIELQPKLLRVLQEREFERVGGTRTLRADARLIAATNSDLEAMVAKRSFREDLFYRLNVFPIILPPLRDRRGDIPLLVHHFVEGLSRKLGRPAPRVPPAVLARLESHHWSGNIRELQNVIERSLITSERDVLELCAFETRPPVLHSSDDALASVNRDHILSVLERTNWVVAGPNGAAARLGLKRSTLNSRMQRLGISRASSARIAR